MESSSNRAVEKVGKRGGQNISYKLLIEAKTKSKAKILGILTREKTYLEGQNYSLNFALTNLGDNPFPGGKLSLDIVWPTEQRSKISIDLPNILPKESFKTEEEDSYAFSRGYVLFQSVQITSSDGKTVKVYKDRDAPVLANEYSIHSIYCKSNEELYEFWGMLLAAISLFIIALEKIVEFFLWISSVLPN